MIPFIEVSVGHRQQEVIDESGKPHKVSIQDVKLVYPIDKLIGHSPDVTTFRHATKYVVCPMLIKDSQWELNPQNQRVPIAQGNNSQSNKQVDKQDDILTINSLHKTAKPTAQGSDKNPI